MLISVNLGKVTDDIVSRLEIRLFVKSNLKLEEIKNQINALPKPGITSCNINKKVFKNLYKYNGYKVLGNYVVRIDILERLDRIIYENIKKVNMEYASLNIVSEQYLSLL